MRPLSEPENLVIEGGRPPEGGLPLQDPHSLKLASFGLASFGLASFGLASFAPRSSFATLAFLAAFRLLIKLFFSIAMVFTHSL